MFEGAFKETVRHGGDIPSHFMLAGYKHHQAQRLSAATQERLCQRWKVSLSKHLQQTTKTNSSGSGRTCQGRRKRHARVQTIPGAARRCPRIRLRHGADVARSAASRVVSDGRSPSNRLE